MISLVDLRPITGINGGMEKALCDLATALSDTYKVRLLYCEPQDAHPDFPISPNVEFINLFSLRPKFWHTAPFLFLRSISRHKRDRKRKRCFLTYLQAKDQIRKCHESNPSDIYIAFDARAGAVTQLAVGNESPVICSLHGCMQVFTEEFQNYSDAFSQLTGFHVLMPSYARELKLRFPTVDIRTIPNPVIKQATPNSPVESKIINVSRLSKQKRVHLLIEAFDILKNRYPSWTVENWGMISERDYSVELETLIADKRLNSRVHLCGVTTNIQEKLSKASVFVLPSDSEGFSLATTEAMAMGIPVIVCNDCRGFDELIENGKNGLVVPPTPEAIASAISLLIENPDVRESIGLAGKIEMEKYSPEKVLFLWTNFIEDSLARYQSLARS